MPGLSAVRGRHLFVLDLLVIALSIVGAMVLRFDSLRFAEEALIYFPAALFPLLVRPPVNVLGGYQQLVRGEVMRGKFRNSLTTPEPFVPGQPTLVAFTLNDVCHAFRKGHRLMVQVQGSWFPLVDRNPQVFLDINAARDEDFRPAEQRLHRSRFLASHVELPVLP